MGHKSCDENKPERRGKQIGMDWSRQRPRDTATPSTPEAMGHSRFDIPRETSAARVGVLCGFMPWTDSNVNQTFTVTEAHGRQTLIAAGIQCNGSGLEKPRAERFRQR